MRFGVEAVAFVGETHSLADEPHQRIRTPNKPIRRNQSSNGTVTSGGSAASRLSAQAHHGQRSRSAASTLTTT